MIKWQKTSETSWNGCLGNICATIIKENSRLFHISVSLVGQVDTDHIWKSQFITNDEVDGLLEATAYMNQVMKDLNTPESKVIEEFLKNRIDLPKPQYTISDIDMYGLFLKNMTDLEIALLKIKYQFHNTPHYAPLQALETAINNLKNSVKCGQIGQYDNI